MKIIKITTTRKETKNFNDRQIISSSVIHAMIFVEEPAIIAEIVARSWTSVLYVDLLTVGTETALQSSNRNRSDNNGNSRNENCDNRNGYQNNRNDGNRQNSSQVPNFQKAENNQQNSANKFHNQNPGNEQTLD